MFRRNPRVMWLSRCIRPGSPRKVKVESQIVTRLPCGGIGLGDCVYVLNLFHVMPSGTTTHLLAALWSSCGSTSVA
jgi:hypothetical protein